MQAISETLKQKNNVKTFNKINTKNVKTLNVNGYDVKRISHYLCEKLNDYGSQAFFCKAAWSIPESELMIFLENAHKPNVRDPRRVFAWQCNQAMQRRLVSDLV